MRRLHWWFGTLCIIAAFVLFTTVTLAVSSSEPEMVLLQPATPNVPAEVQVALDGLTEFVRTLPPAYTSSYVRFDERYRELAQTRDLRFSDVEGYEFSPGYAQETNICNTDDTRDPGLFAFTVPVYRVEFRLKEVSGAGVSYFFNVEIGSAEATFCGDLYIAATPTPTVDLTRTTLTFTPLPSRTPTRTNTPRPSLTFTRTRTSTRTPTFTPSLTFTPSTTPRPDAITCPGFVVSRLVVGEDGRVIADAVRLRDQPASSGAQIASITTDLTFTVLEGPDCDPSGIAWWRVAYRSVEGWLAEGLGTDYFVEPILGTARSATPTLLAPTRTSRSVLTPTPQPVAFTCPGFLPSRLLVGGQGRVLPGDANNVRDIPDASGALVGQIPGGGVFAVLEGPTCDPAGRAWWRVDYNGLIGWTVEGAGDEYYTESFG